MEKKGKKREGAKLCDVGLVCRSLLIDELQIMHNEFCLPNHFHRKSTTIIIDSEAIHLHNNHMLTRKNYVDVRIIYLSVLCITKTTKYF